MVSITECETVKRKKHKVDGEVIDSDVTLIFPTQHGGDIVLVSLSDFFKFNKERSCHVGEVKNRTGLFAALKHQHLTTPRESGCRRVRLQMPA